MKFVNIFQGNEYIQSVARCLQMMLRIDAYRQAFVHLDGISTLVSVLSGRVNFQIQYQLSFCLWVLTFNASIAEKLNKYVFYEAKVCFKQIIICFTSLQIWSNSYFGRYSDRCPEGKS